MSISLTDFAALWFNLMDKILTRARTDVCIVDAVVFRLLSSARPSRLLLTILACVFDVE